MLLNYGEAILLRSNVETEPGGRTGVLTLTNLRVVFEARQSGGLFGATSTTIAFELPLPAIRDVQANRRIVGRPILQLQSHLGAHRFKSTEAEQWVQTIARARSAIPPPPPPTSGGHMPPVVVNVQTNSGPALPPPPPMVFLHCRMCGTLNPAGRGGRCSSCGAAL